MEIEIGIAKSGRRAWGFDDIAIVPSRRTRDPELVDRLTDVNPDQAQGIARQWVDQLRGRLMFRRTPT